MIYQAVQMFFTKKERAEIKTAILDAERNTSGEIRVHIDYRCKEEVMDRAAFIFKTLNIHKTKLRNGILFYIAKSDQKFAILGDMGINARVPEGFWNHIKETMLSHFKEQRFTQGLISGIKMTGDKLKEYFPYQSDDKNDLSDDISFGKK